MFAHFPYETLLEWHAEFGRHDLPWRKGLSERSEKDRGYRVWLSEILLQQTQASRVSGYFERIVERFPDVESLAETDFETFFPYYEGLGYYSRARNLLAAAKEVVGRFGGTFPRTTAELRSLPGVGPYTAEAVRAFAYGMPTLPFDTNLEKVFSRYYFGTRFRKLSDAEKIEIREAFTVSGYDARTVSGALMDFANLVSANSVAKVDWDSYQLPGCRFYETRGALEDRPKKNAERFPMKDAVLIAILADHSGKTLRSSSDGEYAPFTVNPTEDDPREAIKAKFRELGLAVSVRPPYSKGFSDGAPFAFFRCRIQTGDIPSGTYPPEAFETWWRTRSGGKENDFSKSPA